MAVAIARDDLDAAGLRRSAAWSRDADAARRMLALALVLEGALPLTPYAPELNPVEPIWLFLRQKQLSNRVYDTCDAIVDACCTAWNALMIAPERIVSIATRSWAQVTA